MSTLGSKWKELSAEEKKVYLDESKVQKKGKLQYQIWQVVVYYFLCDIDYVDCVVYWKFCITEQENEEAKDEKNEDVDGPPQKKPKKSANTDKKVKQDTKKKNEESVAHDLNNEDSDDSDSSE